MINIDEGIGLAKAVGRLTLAVHQLELQLAEKARELTERTQELMALREETTRSAMTVDEALETP